MTNIDYEHIYQLTFRKQWIELLDLVYKYSKTASSNELIINAVKTFEDEFFGDLDNDIKIDNIQTILEKLILLDKGRIYKLSEDRSCKVVVGLVKIYRNQGLLDKAYQYSMFSPKNDICAEVISLHQKSLPKIVEHSQSYKVKVTENRNIATVNYTTSLFKSRQEIEFFMGVREVFQMFVVYPNVALSCIVDFDKIKENLSTDEKNFFFKGILDCVVFDQHNSYKPIKFFELDSFYHDTNKQRQKDNFKDKILSLAGQKLYRIRKTSHQQERVEFMKLIKEVVE